MTALNTPNTQAAAARRQWLKHALLSGAQTTARMNP